MNITLIQYFKAIPCYFQILKFKSFSCTFSVYPVNNCVIGPTTAKYTMCDKLTIIFYNITSRE